MRTHIVLVMHVPKVVSYLVAWSEAAKSTALGHQGKGEVIGPAPGHDVRLLMGWDLSHLTHAIPQTLDLTTRSRAESAVCLGEAFQEKTELTVTWFLRLRTLGS